MKIFGIGLSKTGTTSLAGALEILGFRTRDYPGLTNYIPGDLATFAPDIIDSHDALTDTPVPSFYRELDAQYPGSKFVLTVREMEGWLNSCKKQFTDKHAANLSPAHHDLFMDLYGTTVFDSKRFQDGYERFLQGVLVHFRDRSSDLLVLNVSNGEGWEKLCSFLGRPQPEIPFPKANVTRIRWLKIDDVVDIAREAAGLIPHLRTDRAPGQMVRARATLDRWIGNLQAGTPGSIEGTRKAIDRHIRERLTALGPQIPVLSPFTPELVEGEIARLNHFWLVEPLDGAGTDAVSAPGAAVSIALIEDQKPIYGVVYLPASDTVYHAAMGKGAFKRQGQAQAMKLTPRRAGARRMPAHTESAAADSPPACAAVRLCHVAEGLAPMDVVLRDARDWQFAAGDAILRAVELRLHTCGVPVVPPYRRAAVVHDCLRIGPVV